MSSPQNPSSPSWKAAGILIAAVIALWGAKYLPSSKSEPTGPTSSPPATPAPEMRAQVAPVAVTPPKPISPQPPAEDSEFLRKLAPLEQRRAAVFDDLEADKVTAYWAENELKTVQGELEKLLADYTDVSATNRQRAEEIKSRSNPEDFADVFAYHHALEEMTAYGKTTGLSGAEGARVLQKVAKWVEQFEAAIGRSKGRVPESRYTLAMERLNAFKEKLSAYAALNEAMIEDDKRRRKK